MMRGMDDMFSVDLGDNMTAALDALVFAHLALLNIID